MIVYRFRVVIEDQPEIVREIDLLPQQTFADFHRCLHQSLGYDAEKSSSFYVSNDQWLKGKEITYLPTPKQEERGVTLMEKTSLNSFIDEPYQKFYYVYDFDRSTEFQVELIKIIDGDAQASYPVLSKQEGVAPKLVERGLASVGISAPLENEDALEAQFDEKDLEDADDLLLENETLLVDDRTPESEDEDEFSETYGEGEDEFSSDNNGYEDEY